MVFNSYSFLVFLAVVLAFSKSTASWSTRKTFLIGASYLFYAAWNPPFVVLIWISTWVDWKVAQWIYGSDSQAKKRMLLLCSLITNLGILGFFKYGDFVLENFIQFTQALGFEFQPAPLDIILPVGISFYTFQTLSYTIDVYRGQLKPDYSLKDFALFVTFFPQLVAGPIVRARDFLPQTLNSPVIKRERMQWGIALLILGLFQKVVLADGLMAPIVERVYDGVGIPSTYSVVIGTLAFSGQIFFDFAGYSIIAIGVSMMLGFSLPDNFRFPYASCGFRDFWERWHISLSTWLRDYLYISLGGNRFGVARTYISLAVTMLLGGLWHGASWNFVFWGGLHGSYLIAERQLVEHYGEYPFWSTLAGRIIMTALTFGLVCFAWIFFRSPSFDRTIDILAGMTMLAPASLWVNDSDVLITLTVVGALLVMHFLLRNTTLEAVSTRLSGWVKITLLAFMIFFIAISPGEDRAFIYFQF